MSLSKNSGGGSGSVVNAKSNVNVKEDESTTPPSTKLTTTSNKLIVRMDQDSDDNMQALFDSVLNPGDSRRPLQVPFRMRKLPNSFFNPPPASTTRSPSISHSRTGSADSAYDAGSQQNVNKSANQSTSAPPFPAPPAVVSPNAVSAATAISQNPNRLTICHSRAHSSPASLQQTYSMQSDTLTGENRIACVQEEVASTGGFAGGQAAVGGGFGAGVTAASVAANVLAATQEPPSNPVPAFHMKQRSFDVVSPIALQNELGSLPSGWEQAKTNDGQIYYLNHLTKTTQWEDPRIQYKQQQRLLQQQQAANQTVHLKGANKDSIAALAESLGALPEGWEQAFTETGDIYFINHVDRTTSWNDPRIPDYLQKSNIKVPKSELTWVNAHQLEKEQEFFKQPEQNAMTRLNASLQMDPFLSGDNHARQESSDSGLSLSSNTFSVNTEFISQIDDSMDCISENSGLNGLDCPDNLVSSLQLEDNICNEMFNDVHSILNTTSTKPDSLEWYKIN